jgi:hypothetical protein
LKNFVTAAFMSGRQLSWNPPLDSRRHPATTVRPSGHGIHSRTSPGSWFRSCVLLIVLVAVQIGCAAKPNTTISVPEKPTPLPDPHSRLDAGRSVTRPVTNQLLERSD